MNNISISDVTLRYLSEISGTVSFKEKIEIAKILDSLKVSAIELPVPDSGKADEILIKTISMSVSNSVVAVPTGYDENDIDRIWGCLKEAKHPRLQVIVPLSVVKMEYICHKKSKKMLDMIKSIASKACSLCNDVEFVVEDATRSDKALLADAFKLVYDLGIRRITICDDAGNMLPDEFNSFVSDLFAATEELKDVCFGVQTSDALELGVACGISAIKAGAQCVKTAICRCRIPYTESVAQIFRLKGDDMGLTCGIRYTELNRATETVDDILNSRKKKSILNESASAVYDDFTLDANDDINSVTNRIKHLGYDLSIEDSSKVYQEFKRISEKKKKVGAIELDAIIASVALQVPPTYRVSSYVINSGNVISATAHVTLEKDGVLKDGIAIGDGSIDAAFLAIEQIIGHHYELDDFQIQSITEGHEAMGSALVKLRVNGNLFSGKGISTDIIGASIRAYINALNKIVYEEK